jgi:hypothetical protein
MADHPSEKDAGRPPRLREGPRSAEAIRKAIESFGVTDPTQQSRLSAIKVKEVSA